MKTVLTIKYDTACFIVIAKFGLFVVPQFKHHLRAIHPPEYKQDTCCLTKKIYLKKIKNNETINALMLYSLKCPVKVQWQPYPKITRIMGPLAYLHTETCFTPTVLTNLVSALFFYPVVCVYLQVIWIIQTKEIVQLLFPSCLGSSIIY